MIFSRKKIFACKANEGENDQHMNTATQISSFASWITYLLNELKCVFANDFLLDIRELLYIRQPFWNHLSKSEQDFLQFFGRTVDSCETFNSVKIKLSYFLKEQYFILHMSKRMFLSAENKIVSAFWWIFFWTSEARLLILNKFSIVFKVSEKTKIVVPQPCLRANPWWKIE